jgi:hypothetical protein
VGGGRFCPASDGARCGYKCRFRVLCETNPEGVRAMMAALDPETVDAISAVLREVAPVDGSTPRNVGGELL